MKELYRVDCRDDEGKLQIVIVRRKRPFFWWLRRKSSVERGFILYALPDGTPVKFVDERTFEIVGSGARLTRED